MTDIAHRVSIWVRTRLLRLRSAQDALGPNREHFDKRDAESFIAAQLPTGEEVGLRCIWVCEAYLAGQVSQLAESLRGLGLDTPFTIPELTTASVLKARAGSGLIWHDLGYLLPASVAANRSQALPGRPACLPPGVESVFLTVTTTLPSATILVAQFRFDDKTARDIEIPFRTQYRTTEVRDKEFRRILSDENLRDRAVQDHRSQLRERCQGWLANNVPGAFIALGGEPPPTSELITFAIGDPLVGLHTDTPASNRLKDTADSSVVENRSPRTRSNWNSYMAILGQQDEWLAWRCPEIPGLSFRFQREAWVDPLNDFSVLSARVADFAPAFKRGDDSVRTALGVTQGLYYLHHTIGILALAQLARRYEIKVARLRDELGGVRLDQPSQAISSLTRIDRELATVAQDARPFLNDVVGAADDVWHHPDVYTFVPLRKDDGDLRLFPWLMRDLKERSQRVLRLDAIVSETCERMSNHVAASVNLRLTRVNIGLQWLMVVLTVVAVILAGLAPPGALHSLLGLFLAATLTVPRFSSP